MKIKFLLAVLIILTIASCKKDSTTTTHAAVFSFDIDGQHRSFNMGQLQLQVIDTGAAKGKYLSLNTGNGALPQVQFNITDRSQGYSTSCFSPGPYTAFTSNPLCNDSIATNFCVGFYMQYTDTGVGRVALYATNDSVSLLTLTSCANGLNGKPDTLNATFSCVLTDSTGFISPKHITNGQLSYITYTHQ